MDSEHNLKIKGYGDPFLVSEVWEKCADLVAAKVRVFEDLVLDDTYFSHRISIPGCDGSTNPYDAPVGALCINFNTIFFDRDQGGEVASAEPQTPMIPFALDKIESLGLKKGRHAFINNSREAALYAGELFLHFLRKRGVACRGGTRMGAVEPRDRLIHTYRSRFTLEQVLKKMLKFSSNFIANQICISLGARQWGPPGTLPKGVRVIRDYAGKVLNLRDVLIVEGSGVSRKNRISAIDMLSVLGQFLPYRHLLVKKNEFSYKTGTLMGIRARSGYFDGGHGDPSYFVVFLDNSGSEMESLMKCIKEVLTNPDMDI